VLFDLRGKRRRVVQVVYATLAGLFLVGFVAFGIGSDVSGGFADLFNGGSSGGSVSSQFDDQIDAANEQLAKDPKDTAALLKLAEFQYLKGQQGVTVDEATGQPSVSEDAHTELGKAADAWNRYLQVNQGEPNPNVAAQVVNAFIFLNDFAGAARTFAIVAADQPSPNSYGNLAIYRYFSGDISGGDAAADKAVAEAPKAQRKAIEQQLDDIRKQAVKAKKQQAKAQKNAPSPTTPGANPLQSPLGGTSTAP
jgi:hypothetical protein